MPKATPSRRQVVRSLAGGSMLFPALVSQLLAAESPARGKAPADPLAPRPPHFPARAKRVIFMYMSGGVSHVDSLDYKPRLFAEAGKKLADLKYAKRPNWDFKPRGRSGIEVSELFPHVGSVVDDLCVIRSMRGDHNNHFEATLGIHTGSVTFTRPSMGSWVSYGLGTFNRNLPSFMVLAPKLPYAGAQTWSSDFLPPCHEGVRVIPGPAPIRDLARSAASADLQGLELSMLQRLNRAQLDRESASADRLGTPLTGADPVLAGRIRSFEMAADMQAQAPEAFDLSGESDETLALYGLPRGSTAGFAWQCLVARRLAERGVRFVELIDSGSSNNWDAHGDMQTHAPLARNVDRPAAALIRDLKRRGMLDDTLVVWTTEFGRTPYVAEPTMKGREHHSKVFSTWLAGGGVKAGYVHGASDDFGIEAAQDPVHVHDLHATILHLLGLNHEKLTFRHAGRDFRLTDVYGQVVQPILA